MAHLWLKQLTPESIIEQARLFTQSPIQAAHITGPRLGEIIENEFVDRLSAMGYDVGEMNGATCDLPTVNVDIKSLQLNGKRGGSPKIHGYSKCGPPDYSILLFGYEYKNPEITITDVFWIDECEISWTQAEHYIWSIPQGKLDIWRF